MPVVSSNPVTVVPFLQVFSETPVFGVEYTQEAGEGGAPATSAEQLSADMDAVAEFDDVEPPADTFASYFADGDHAQVTSTRRLGLLLVILFEHWYMCSIFYLYSGWDDTYVCCGPTVMIPISDVLSPSLSGCEAISIS